MKKIGFLNIILFITSVQQNPHVIACEPNADQLSECPKGPGAARIVFFDASDC